MPTTEEIGQICGQTHIEPTEEDVIILNKKWIEEQKVKEAIKRKIKEHDNGDCNYDALCELLKELSIE